MRILNSSENYYTVKADYWDVSEFCDCWPASGLHNVGSVIATFDRSGNLVDLEVTEEGAADNTDGGGALAALTEDMQDYARTRGYA